MVTLNIEMVDLVFKQISAVQGSLMDIDFKAIAEEINFDFEFFASADKEHKAKIGLKIIKQIDLETLEEN